MTGFALGDICFSLRHFIDEQSQTTLLCFRVENTRLSGKYPATNAFIFPVTWLGTSWTALLYPSTLLVTESAVLQVGSPNMTMSTYSATEFDFSKTSQM